MPFERWVVLLRLFNMDTVEKVLRIKPPKVPKSTLIGHVCANKDLICGVELEIENITHKSGYGIVAAEIFEKINQNIWSLERDGSLRPADWSWEFISKPLPMEYALAEMTALFAKFDFQDSNYSDRTSVHVHTNVVDFTQAQIASLALVYTVFEDVLFHYANHHKEKTEYGYCRDTGVYCIPWNQCRMNVEFVRKMFNDPKSAVKNWQKYTALNMLPIATQGTVEWRHMHGTNDMEKLKTWFNLIGSIMAFAKKVDFDDVVKTIQSLNDTSAYQQFFYSVLQNYLPYNESYAHCMAEGVMHAKYGLINKDVKLEKKVTIDDLLEEQIAVNNAQAIAEVNARLARQAQEIALPAAAAFARDAGRPQRLRPRREGLLQPAVPAVNWAVDFENQQQQQPLNDFNEEDE
jgi:hypothetical protein